MFLGSKKLKIGLLILLGLALVGAGYYFFTRKSGQAPTWFPFFASPAPVEPSVSLDNPEDLTAAIIDEVNSEVFSEELYSDSGLVVSDEDSINNLYQTYDASQL